MSQKISFHSAFFGVLFASFASFVPRGVGFYFSFKLKITLNEIARFPCWCFSPVFCLVLSFLPVASILSIPGYFSRMWGVWIQWRIC